MASNRASVGAALLAATLLGSPRDALAGGPPSALYGKSIRIHWQESRNGKFTDGSTFRRTVNADYAFYVSERGRVFSRSSRVMVNKRGNETGSMGTSRAPDGATILATKNRY